MFSHGYNTDFLYMLYTFQYTRFPTEIIN